MFNTQHPLSWFESKVNNVVIRNNRPFRITNQKDAEYCHTLQDQGFVFAEVTPKKPTVIVSMNNCQSCEG